MGIGAIGKLTVMFGADFKGFDRAMKKAQRNLKKFGKSMTRIGKDVSQKVTLPILGLGVAAVKMASDFQETDSKFKQVFISIGKEAEKTAKRFKDSFGLSEKAAKQLLSDTGDLLVGFGFTEKGALDLATQVNELAVDLASFTNFEGGAEGASRALTKALVGETESAKALGIVIRQGTKEYKERVAQIQKANGVSILQAKALANLEIAVSQSGKAIGDFARTQEEFANKMRILKGDVHDLSVEFGVILLPTAEKLLIKFGELIDRLSKLSAKQKENTIEWAGLAAIIGPLLIILGSVINSFSRILPFLVKIGTVIKKNPFSILIISLSALYIKLDKAKPIADRFADGWQKIKNKINGATKAYNKFKESGALDFRTQERDAKTDPGDILRRMMGGGMTGGEGTPSINVPKPKPKPKSVKIDGNGTETGEVITMMESLGPVLLDTSRAWRTYYEEIAESSIMADEAQLRMNKTTELFGDIMARSMTQALNSGENFFESLISGVISAIKALLIQLAVLISINYLLGNWKGAAEGVTAATAAMNSVLGLAGGGLVTGPTLALVGEGSGTSISNPEVVAPLDKLKNMMGGSQNVIVEGVIKGNDIFLSNSRTGRQRERFV